MADKGVDAISSGDIVYQVKWSSKFEKNPETWLSNAIDGERAKIHQLVRERNISKYILMTSVAGTTASPGDGSIEKLQRKLDAYTAEFKVPVECWWQSDIDAEVDAAPDSIKWSYQEMLAGSDAIRYLMHGSQLESEAAQMRETLLHVMAAQWRDDSKIKFRQRDMEGVNVADLFVDVQASLVAHPRRAVDQFNSTQNQKVHGSAGAVQQLLRTTAPLTFLLGVPGQGKSTLSQYLSQIHRAAILPGDMLGDRKPPHDEVREPQLPLRVDLRDYAEWLAGNDPFGEEDEPRKSKARRKAERSLELFLAEFCSAASGGRKVDVEQVQSLLTRYPTLLVLDGLDEVADTHLRQIVVDEINLTATRMGARIGSNTQLRRFQILVTSRPNATGLAEPDPDTFQTLKLEPLSPQLQDEFVTKWCDVNDIDGKDRNKLRRIFRDRSTLDHVAQLADNPMQLTILLFLISRKGDAVPISRTPLYTDYMATLLDREVNRRQIEREHVPLVQEVTAFLGWHMHAGVETAPAAGRMPLDDIETTLLMYFRKTGGPHEESNQLFKAASDRFWALTSKEDGTFEFAVQPVREYFAAKFLSEWAGRERKEPLQKKDILRNLIERTYWFNTARFYAGFASPNELAGLRYGLEEAIASGTHPLQERAAAWTLLSDGIFANDRPVQRDVVRLLTDDLTVRLVSHLDRSDSNFPRLSQQAGGQLLATELLDSLKQSPAHPLTPSRVQLLRRRAGTDSTIFTKWWLEQLAAAAGTPQEADWLAIGGEYGPQKVPPTIANRLGLTEVRSQQGALAAGVVPAPESGAASHLLRAVLDGHASDVRAAPSTEAGALLRAMRPQWFQGRQPHARVTGHFHLDNLDTSVRADAWKRLVTISSKYERLKGAARARKVAQSGTTEPWQNPARELTRIHGPSWLAAEIAITGAATLDTHGSGSNDKDGEPFGPMVDYGTFVIQVHHRHDAGWWQTMHDRYGDTLSRRTWALGLLAAGTVPAVEHHLCAIDAILATLSNEEFTATAASSSRIGLSRTGRPLPESVAQTQPGITLRTHLLLAHFMGNEQELQTLPTLSDSDLTELASPDPSAWPVAEALAARMLARPNSQILDGIAKLGTEQSVNFRQDENPPPAEFVASILRHAERFPAEWVAAAAHWRSAGKTTGPLEETAIREMWVPKIPRL